MKLRVARCLYACVVIPAKAGIPPAVILAKAGIQEKQAGMVKR